MQTTVPSSTQGVNGFGNFGDATTKGIDFELRWRTPLTGLSLGAVGNVNDGKFDYVDPEVQVALPLIRPGNRIVNSIKRSAERRVGKECVRTCRSRWSPYHYKK